MSKRVATLCRNAIVGIASLQAISSAATIGVDRSLPGNLMVSQVAQLQGDISVFGSDYFLALLSGQGADQVVFFTPRSLDAAGSTPSGPSSSATPSASPVADPWVYSGPVEERLVAAGGLPGPTHLLLGTAGIVVQLDPAVLETTTPSLEPVSKPSNAGSGFVDLPSSSLPVWSPDEAAGGEVLTALGTSTQSMGRVTTTAVAASGAPIMSAGTAQPGSTGAAASQTEPAAVGLAGSLTTGDATTVLVADAPEPASILLTASALALLAVRIRRSK